MTESSDTVFEKRFNLGERVVDSDESNPDTAIAVNTPDVTASEWDVNKRHTVASFPGNERYPDDAAVVIVVFSDELSESYPDYAGGTPIPLTELSEKGVTFYAFPAPRLSAKRGSDPAGKIYEEADTSGSDPDLGDEFAAVTERLEEGGMTVEYDDEADVLRAEKLGEEYTIHRDGSVTGDGVLRDRLADVVKEVIR